jgi:hypothetical protein
MDGAARDGIGSCQVRADGGRHHRQHKLLQANTILLGSLNALCRDRGTLKVNLPRYSAACFLSLFAQWTVKRCSSLRLRASFFIPSALEIRVRHSSLFLHHALPHMHGFLECQPVG